MSNKHYFHFTLGPVQSFVSQARRTRDFWAGSFLLSWLSAVAIKAVIHQENNNADVILFPKANKEYLAFIEGKGKGKPPKQGSIPNRFKAEINLDTFEPEQVTEAVQKAWVELANHIWKEDILKVLGENPILEQVGKVWERQIPAFWDISWVITPEIIDSSALDERKNWRTYVTPPEPGVKCSMMNGWQELSGIKRPNKSQHDKFWGELRKKDKNGIKNDIKENEYLCSIAYIKRRFSRYFNDSFIIEMPQKWILEGWEVPSGVPSVSYLSAVHWLEQANTYCDKALLKKFHDEAKKLTGEYGEWQTDIKCLRNGEDKKSKYFNSLDGNVFYRNNLENKNMFPDEEQQKQAEKVLELLKEINSTKIKSIKNSFTKTLSPATPFYAILMMDGDSLGKNMSDTDKQDIISQGLSTFTEEVEDIVYNNNGFLIYAGGDDVLAILPLENAIPCARELRTFYNTCFEGNETLQTSLSGAIEFVHNKTPLTKILKDAHQLLDDIAKEKTGRDALAIRAWKPGGLQQEWAQPWEIALNPDTGITYLEEIATDFNNQDDDSFSSKFLFKIRERFNTLNPIDEKKDQLLDEELAKSLMVMEYLNSNNNKKLSMADAKAKIEPLLIQCRPIKRDIEKSLDSKRWEKSKRLEAGGALLIRFLAQKGAE